MDMAQNLGKMHEIWGKTGVMNRNLGKMGGYGLKFGGNGWIRPEIWGKWVNVGRNLGKSGRYEPKLGKWRGANVSRRSCGCWGAEDGRRVGREGRG